MKYLLVLFFSISLFSCQNTSENQQKLEPVQKEEVLKIKTISEDSTLVLIEKYFSDSMNVQMNFKRTESLKLDSLNNTDSFSDTKLGDFLLPKDSSMEYLVSKFEVFKMNIGDEESCEYILLKEEDYLRSMGIREMYVFNYNRENEQIRLVGQDHLSSWRSGLLDLSIDSLFGNHKQLIVHADPYEPSVFNSLAIKIYYIKNNSLREENLLELHEGAQGDWIINAAFEFKRNKYPVEIYSISSQDNSKDSTLNKLFELHYTWNPELYKYNIDTIH